MSEATKVFADEKGKATITEKDDGIKLIKVQSYDGHFVPIKSCRTVYPLSLIELIFRIKGSGYLCDEICRETNPDYVQRDLKKDLTAYFTKKEFTGKRILDFGSGSGASTMILSRMFPDAEIVGIELEEKLLDIARARLEFYKYPNIKFYLSPSGVELPPDVGEFDFVIMSAVYEHLLPKERETVIPQVWSIIKQDGNLFLNMTPHRWFLVEHHTTGLPLLNYLPPKLALPVSRKFSGRIDKTEPWETLLRRGIRGGTENEILGILEKNFKNKPILLEPSQKNLKDRIDLWHSQLNQKNHRTIKRLLKSFLKTVRAVSGVTLVPNLSLVVKKV
ncbi:MAG: class I SAM-dependent methyltransferase [Acidobacteria bacterium]|nr:class I SAM-dependent methyltransferase [Acidobacteriota bacterium]